MAAIINFPTDEKVIAVTLTGAEWLQIMLKLARRGHDPDLADAAEANMLQQLKGEA